MKFALATLYVKDMERSLAFYQGLLGVPLLSRQPMEPGGEMAFLGEDGQPNLELISTGSDTAYAGFSIGFETKDLGALKEKLAANGYTVKKEMSPSPSVTLCFLDGPDGEEVELISYQ